MLVQVAQQLQPELGFPAWIAKPAQLVSGLVLVIADLAPEALSGTSSMCASSVRT
jgi:hypothetical protein